MSKRAVILAGGKGTRLKPFTVVLPKPLMPIGDYAILEIVIRQLIYYGFDHITMAVNHQVDLIMAFFGDGAKWGIKIDYSLEDQPLSTMGPLKLIKNLPDDFLIMNGDVLTDLNYREFMNFHLTQQNVFTISAYTRKHISQYGVLEADEQGRLIGFKEKPSFEFEVSMGVYAAHKNILEIIPENTFYGFDHLMLELIKRKTPAMVRPFSGHWLDIGIMEDYSEANEIFENNKSIYLKDSKK
jgi:NDP-sugar pyrophosphorylase family protein